MKNAEASRQLLRAIGRRDISGMRKALDAGGDPDMRTPAGDTALTACALLGRAPEVRLLLDHGADANASDADGNTIIMRLALLGIGDNHYGVFDMLTQNGADIQAQNAKGFRAIDYAARAALAEVREVALGREDSRPCVAQMVLHRLLSMGATIDRAATRVAVQQLGARLRSGRE